MKTSEPERNPTRDRLIEAAGEVFADQGFHAATVRQITRRAGVNVAAVNYHFRDKDELYAETLRHAHCAARNLPFEAEAELGAEERLYLFVENLLRRFFDPVRPRWHGQLIAREMAQPTRIFGQLVEESFRPKCGWLRRAIAELAGGRLDDETLDLATTSVLGQCILYRQNRQVIQTIFPGLLAHDDFVERLARHITDFSLAAIRNLNTQPSTHEHLLETR